MTAIKPSLMLSSMPQANAVIRWLGAQVFLPLTRLCRDACGYCTFALPPASGRRCFMTLQEVLSIARAGAAQGCTEALFTLGEQCQWLLSCTITVTTAVQCSVSRYNQFTLTLEYLPC